jgi:SAM-dependent methyltransferase
MLHDLHNPTRATRIVYDVAGREVRVAPGASVSRVALPEELVQALRRSTGDLVLTRDWAEAEREREAVENKQPRTGAVVVDGMWGIGDNIHQRAVMRELLKREDVWLTTCHWHVYHDLPVNLMFKETRLRAQAKTIARERAVFKVPVAVPSSARKIKLWYRKDQIDHYGSILQAMAGTCGVDHTKPLDFSLPIPKEWHDHVPPIDTGGKPLMVYRPIVLRKEWNSANRNPDPAAYRAIYDSIRARYFVISIADLLPGAEWIVGPEAPVNLRLHAGELDFQGMAALFSRADLAFCNAGFGPVLAQAVGTPVITVYGGRESYATTQRAGAHLAPTLGIDPIRPCDCHDAQCKCGSDKRIDAPRALERVAEFVREKPAEIRAKGRSDTLIFATTYVDNRDRQHLTEMWLELTHRLNPDADLLIVDSASPMPVVGEEFKRDAPPFELFDFGNNIGHLSRKGRDGWGRAFCKGLDLAVERGYQWVAHVEGDSLLRVPVGPIFRELGNFGCATTPVQGTGVPGREIAQWVETGLMFFSTKYLRESKFTERYNWPARTERPTPEKIIFHQLRGDVKMLPLKALRSDKQQITRDGVVGMDLDWITHCHDDVWCYDRFFEAAMAKVAAASIAGGESAGSSAIRSQPIVKVNLGCGENRLAGWDNHDIDVDITRRLPWADGSTDFIFIEHCVEHVGYRQAIGFFEEALRVLRPGGVLRVVVPSIEQILAADDQAYWEFTKKWGGEATRRGAARAILFSHGHEMAWTESLMRSLLTYAGFDPVTLSTVGSSSHPELRGVEGHGKVIGEAFNRIESMVFEATKGQGASLARLNALPAVQDQPPSLGAQAVTVASSVAVIVGGGRDVEADLAAARGLVGANATYLVINDMIPRFPGPCIAVTLHPQKIGEWLREREANGFSVPVQVWAHSRGSRARPYSDITHVTDDWRGSSGLFAVKIARQQGFSRIVLAGVPMRTEDKHFLRAEDWKACASFRLAWAARRAEIAPHVRSMSGWTAETFGRPDATFLGVSA